MKAIALVTLCLGFLVVPNVYVQTDQTLHPGETVLVPEVHTKMLAAPFKCDASGAIYIRELRNPDDSWKNPVVRILPNGKVGTRFSLATIPGMETDGIMDFAPADDGAVRLLVTGYDPGARYVVTLDKADRLISKEKLPTRIWPYQIGSFPDGRIFIAGSPATDDDMPVHGAVFAGILDAKGDLISILQLPEDAVPNYSGQSNLDSNYQNALRMSMTEPGPRGDVLFLRWAMETPIYEVNPDNGIRVLHLNAPKGSWLGSVHADGDTVAALLVGMSSPRGSEIKSVSLSLWDSETGEEIGEYYERPLTFGAAFACYKSGVATFLKPGPNDTLELVNVAVSPH